ncbi:Glutamate receptor 2.2 [Thalictrum thalictroides]|uniref:Glutamate receptor 2.2 n=1 Tax=Thalictrum thalictroides TaxID=46969 RepID=A0A7J6WIU7_THATH|nr:Glutamate receptor 2.2 [Thalictrum thalictroides]
MVIIWLFLVSGLTSNYVVTLTSILNWEQQEPAITNSNELIESGDFVGYRRGTFVIDLLKRVGFDESKLKPYNSPEECQELLSKGSQNGGVSAIFDEMPYVDIFLSKYCFKYAKVGPTHKTDGFGFVFPKGSPLVSDISKAVLEVTEGIKLIEKEREWFTPNTTCEDVPWAIFTSTDPSSLIQISICVLVLFLLITSIFKESSKELTLRCRALTAAHENTGITEATQFHVGVILDLESWNGRMSNNCISMAAQDFYALNAHYRTRLVLHTEDSKDVGSAVLKAVDMLKDVKMQMIVGPQTSAQAEIIAEIGSKSHVPVVSFSATSPSLSKSPAPYFIRMAQNDTYQLGAIASLIQAFGWKEVVLIYEETDYGNGIIPYLIEAFQTIDVRVPYRSSIHPSATDDHILKELEKLSAIPTRVFIVHMLSPLGPRFFLQAKAAGLMTEGNAWIITEGFTNILGSLELSVIDAMLGVLGIKPYIPRSERLLRFKARMNKKNVQESDTHDLNIFCLHAYDTIWALAMAGERVGKNHNFQKPKQYRNKSNFSLGISERGPQFLEEILKSSFKGLSGEIRLVDGQLQPPVFQIINVEQMQRKVGFWIPTIGISQLPDVRTTKGLRPIIWPGESMTVPSGKKLKVGYPVKQTFTEFVKVELNHSSNETFVTGYCIDVFKAVMEALPKAIPYDFVPFQKGYGEKGSSTYDDLIYQVFLEKYDVAVGDITVTSHRSLYVDFSLPYTTGGVEMVIPIKYDERSNFVIFLELFCSSVWLSYFAMFVGTIFVYRSLEYLSISDLSFPQQIYKVAGDLFLDGAKFVSKLVAFIFVLTGFMLAGLFEQALQKVVFDDNYQLRVVNAKDLVNSGDFVGYQRGSFVEVVLKQLNFHESQLRVYNSPEEYDQALRKGSKHGGVAAVFDEMPYIKLFLNKYPGKYRRVGPIYRMEGFGFGFRRGSSLVGDVSRAILSVVEGENIMKIEKAWLGSERTYADPIKKTPSENFTIYNTWGIFVIAIILIFSLHMLSMLARTNRQSQNKLFKLLRYIFQVAESPDDDTIISDLNQLLMRMVQIPEKNASARYCLRIHLHYA